MLERSSGHWINVCVCCVCLRCIDDMYKCMNANRVKRRKWKTVRLIIHPFNENKSGQVCCFFVHAYASIYWFRSVSFALAHSNSRSAINKGRCSYSNHSSLLTLHSHSHSLLFVSHTFGQMTINKWIPCTFMAL